MYLRTKNPHENNKIEDTMYCREKERDSGLAVTWRNLLNTDNCILKLYMHNPTDRITHTTAFDTPVVGGALVGTRNSRMGPPFRVDSMTHGAMSERSYHGATSRSLAQERER